MILVDVTSWFRAKPTKPADPPPQPGLRPGHYFVAPSGQVFGPPDPDKPLTDRYRANLLRGQLTNLAEQIEAGVRVRPDQLASIRNILELTK